MTTNVLITNDDGIDSPGLHALARACSAVDGQIYVVAPAENQSAVGASITLRRELHWEEKPGFPVPDVEAWHVNGTPADCVMVGLREIVQHRINLIVSGINQGANVGNDILASGTVGGALHGHFRAITAIAFSRDLHSDAEVGGKVDWAAAESVARSVVARVLDGTIGDGQFLNVNIPALPFDRIAGTLVTRMGRRGFISLEKVRNDAAIAERAPESLHTNPSTPPGTDVWALAHDYISITPLHSNLTEHTAIDMLGEKLTRSAGD
jgi:5'-nucleotidase